MPRAKSEVKDAEVAEDAAGPPPVNAAQSLRTARGVVLGLVIGLFVWGVLALSWWRWA
jgi:hypothetical protein